MERLNRWMGWLAALALAGALAACGGGGGSGDAATRLQAPVPDARNGDYQMYAADGRLYTLALDFDARTWRVAGNAADSAGTFSAAGTEFVFDPAGAAPAHNAARFSTVADGVVGGFRFAGGVVPFVAARAFATTAADAAGAYKLLTRVLDPAVPGNTFIFAGEFVAPNLWRHCADFTIYTIAACPAASVITGTVTQAGDQFTTTVSTGSWNFRVARIGGDKVYLRAGSGGGAQRRFWVGVDQAGGYADGTFSGVNTAAQSTSTQVAGTAVATSARSEANVASSRTGAAGLTAVPGLQSIDMGADGRFFTMRTAELAFVFAARDNPSWPGYVEIGRR